MKKIFTPEQVAKELSISLRVVRKWLREGKIKGVKIGKLWRISELELERLMKVEKEERQTMKNGEILTFQKQGKKGEIHKLGTFYEVEINGMKFTFNKEELKEFLGG